MKSQNNSNPYLAKELHAFAKEKIGVEVLFAKEKENANRIILEDYSLWKEYILNSEKPLFTAFRLAVAGNIIDYGAHSAPKDIKTKIEQLLKQPLALDNSGQLIESISKAKKILYLGDNAGEIVFDKMLIETMNHPNVCYATRGEAVINDVTFFDTKSVDLHSVCKVISNGNNAPSTILEICNQEFLNEFNSADLIISKGQGNFEGLLHEKGRNIFFLLMAKCAPIAKLLQVKKGDQLIVNRSV
ncbi:MAG: DUF89 domain-containing protein [Bacteroidales bacterium]